MPGHLPLASHVPHQAVQQSVAIPAFLHFYDENRYIKSTLFIRGQRVVEEFEKIYDRFLEKSFDPEMEVIRSKDFASSGEVLERLPAMLERFAG